MHFVSPHLLEAYHNFVVRVYLLEGDLIIMLKMGRLLLPCVKVRGLFTSPFRLSVNPEYLGKRV